LIAAAGPAVLLLLAALAVGGTPGSVLLGAAFGSLAMGALRRRTGLDAGADGLVIRGLGGSEVLAWPDVLSVEVLERGGRRALVIETAARQYRAAAPFSSPLLGDDRFEAKARAVGDLWRAHRGDRRG